MNIKDLPQNSYNVVSVPTKSYGVKEQPKKSLLEKIGSVAGLDVLGKKIGYGLARFDPLVREYKEEALADDPTWGQVGGSGLKLASTLVPAGKLVKGGLALKGAISGGTYGLGQSLVEKKDLTGTAKTTAGYAAGGAATGKLLSMLPKGLKKVGVKTTGIGMESSMATRKAIIDYQATKPTLIQRVANFFTGKKVPIGPRPMTEAETVARLLTPGTEHQLGVNAKRVQANLFNRVISPSLKATKDKVDMKVFFNELTKDVVKSNPDLARRNVLLKALKSFKDNYSHVSKVGYEKLQNYKSNWARFIPEKAYRGEPITGALNEVRKIASDKARGMIYDKLGPVVGRAYLDYGNLITIYEEAYKTQRPIDRMFFSRAIWENLMDKVVTPVTSTSGKVLYKTGEGLEFVGEKGMKNVGEVINQVTGK